MLAACDQGLDWVMNVALLADWHADGHRLRVRSKCRACVILSGGVDSSTVAEVGKDVLGLQAAFTVVTSEGLCTNRYDLPLLLVPQLLADVIMAQHMFSSTIKGCMLPLK